MNLHVLVWIFFGVTFFGGLAWDWAILRGRYLKHYAPVADAYVVLGGIGFFSLPILALLGRF